MEISSSKSHHPGKRRVGFAFLFAAVLGACVTPALRAQMVVVPNELASTNGNNVADLSGDATARYMLMYDASQFMALSGPSLLTQFAFRPKVATSPGGPRRATLRLYASTTKRTVAGMSTTFSQNIGTNNTLVFEGTITLVTENLAGPGNTRQFDVVQPFTTPL